MDAKKITLAYRVPYADTDQMQVVYYANYLVYFERARNELLREIGFTYRRLEAMGFGLPVLEAVARYQAPATYDDLLEISAWCGECRGVRLQVNCEVRRDGKLLVAGHTVHAFVQLKTMKPARIAPELLAALGLNGTPAGS
jgi:acyl-CoA thioester hydrolase